MHKHQEKTPPDSLPESSPRDKGTEDLLTAFGSESQPDKVVFLGKEFIIFPNVFSPKYSDSTRLFAENLDVKKEDTVLEIGAGCGAIAILVAYQGPKRVVATDINFDAVRNIEANIELHHMAGKVQARSGDLYKPLKPGEIFSLIFWNVPFCFIQVQPLTDIEKSVYDAGYLSIEKYIKEGREHLTKGGRLLLGFSSTLGRLDLVQKFAKESGLSLQVVTQVVLSEDPPINFEILQLTHVS